MTPDVGSLRAALGRIDDIIADGGRPNERAAMLRAIRIIAREALAEPVTPEPEHDWACGASLGTPDPLCRVCHPEPAPSEREPVTPERRGYWVVDASAKVPEGIHEKLADLLPQAVAAGKQIVVVDGLELRWHVAEPVTPEPLTYERRVEQMAAALHRDCELAADARYALDPRTDPWRAADHRRASYHYGQAHDLVRRIFPELDLDAAIRSICAARSVPQEERT